MKISFYGKFDEESREHIEKIAKERGHEIGRPSAITFLMGYEENVERVGEAQRHGGFAIVLHPGNPTQRALRVFFKAGAYDVLPFPFDENEARRMFANIEAKMGEVFGDS